MTFDGLRNFWSSSTVGRILRRPTWSQMALPNCSSKSLKSEVPMRAAPWACRRFRLVAALRSRWLWRHLYWKVYANCEMHTKKRQSGYRSKSFATPGGTMMEHDLPSPLSSKVPAWFGRKFDFTFPAEQYPYVCARL